MAPGADKNVGPLNYGTRKTTDPDLGRARKSLGATDLVDLKDRRHNKLLSFGNKVFLRYSLVFKMGEV